MLMRSGGRGAVRGPEMCAEIAVGNVPRIPPDLLVFFWAVVFTHQFSTPNYSQGPAKANTLWVRGLRFFII